MAAETPHRLRLRLRLPSGAEFEAEGTPEFISKERLEFLGTNRPAGANPAKGQEETPAEPVWETAVEAKGTALLLRSKLQGPEAERDACLILLAAARRVLRQDKPTASQLARWLRASGYPISRVDRAISPAIEQGEILATGTRRARRYELSGPGLAKGWRLAHRLAAHILPPA